MRSRFAILNEQSVAVKAAWDNVLAQLKAMATRATQTGYTVTCKFGRYWCKIQPGQKNFSNQMMNIGLYGNR